MILNMKKNKEFEKILIGDTLKKVRKSLGYTQEQVADSLELAPRYLSDIERDKTKGSLDTLVKLCNLYKISPSYVLKDYICVPEKINVDETFTGYYNLTPSEKDIIKELIRYFNNKRFNRNTYNDQNKNNQNNESIED